MSETGSIPSPTGGVGISVVATAVMSYGFTELAKDWKVGVILILIGVCIYFLKAYAIKKGYEVV